MLILAVDPGMTTGLAFNINGVYQTQAVTDPTEIYDYIRNNKFDVVVCEQFVTSNIHSHRYGIRTVEIVGGVEAICYVSKVPFHRRTPHQRLPAMPRAKAILKAMRRPFVDHEQDALAQLLCWERFHANVG